MRNRSSILTLNFFSQICEQQLLANNKCSRMVFFIWQMSEKIKRKNRFLRVAKWNKVMIIIYFPCFHQKSVNPIIGSLYFIIFIIFIAPMTNSPQEFVLFTHLDLSQDNEKKIIRSVWDNPAHHKSILKAWQSGIHINFASDFSLFMTYPRHWYTGKSKNEKFCNLNHKHDIFQTTKTAFRC
jgi:hypothetical protein